MPVVPVPLSDIAISGLSYVTLTEGNEYFEWAAVSDAWDSATNLDKCKALVTATRAIDRLNFSGLRTSDMGTTGPLDPSGPGLEFPRNGDTIVPNEIKAACCELAYAYLDGVDPEMEMQALGTTSQRFASVSASFDVSHGYLAVRHGIVSRTAWNYLLPFLVDPLEFNLVRVS